MPKVTVLMPIYNGEKYLYEAIDSILNQTFTDFEFLIIDDGSKDSTQKILNSYQDPRINIIKNNLNQGLIYSLNVGLSVARGEYIARMDCDDISLPNRLEKQVKFLDANSEIGVIGTWVKIINNNQKTEEVWKYPDKNFAIQWSLCFCCPFAHPTVMFRKSLVFPSNKYCSDMTDAEDYGLWWKLSKITLLANLPIVLLLYRQHDNNITKIHSQNHTQKAAQINQAIIKEVLFEEVDYDISYDMFYQRNQTYKQAENISLLIYKIYQKFKQKYNLTKSENHYLKYDAASKIFTFSRPYIRDIKSWRFLILAFSLNPNLILKFIKGLFGNP